MQSYFAQFCMLHEKLIIGELDNKYKDTFKIIVGYCWSKRCYLRFYDMLWCYLFIFTCQLSFLNMYSIMPYVPVQMVSIGMNTRLGPFAILRI